METLRYTAPDVSIAPLCSEHATNMLAWMGDPEVAGNIGLRTHPNLDTTNEWIVRASNSDDIRAYAVLFSGSHVGNVVLYRIDRYLATTRLSVYLGPSSVRGRGIGGAAIRLALTEAFGPLALNKVWLTVHVRNTRAIRAYLNAGFTMEGILRDEFRLAGQFVDVFYMGMRRLDYVARGDK